MATKTTTTWRPQMTVFLRDHHGVVSSAALSMFGCPRRTQYRMVERGELTTILPGIFRSSHWPDGDEQKMVAACLRNASAVVAFISAAVLWNFRKMPQVKGVDILVPHGNSPTMPGLTIHRCRRIDPIDIVSRDDGIRLTSPTRTLFDCADILGEKVTASVLEQLINDGKGTFITHLSTLTRLAHTRRPGTRTMAAVIASRPAWRKAMESDLETRILAEIERQGLPRPAVQYTYTLPTGATVRLDFAWPELKIALEIDHPFWHAGADESHRDKRRDRKMATDGWLTVRITDLDVDAGLSESIRDLADILRLR